MSGETMETTMERKSSVKTQLTGFMTYACNKYLEAALFDIRSFRMKPLSSFIVSARFGIGGQCGIGGEVWPT